MSEAVHLKGEWADRPVGLVTVEGEQPREDEVSLVDLGAVFMRRWRWILGGLLLGLLAGAALAVRPPVYAYHVVLEIGRIPSVVDPSQTALVADAASVEKAIQRGYLPQALDKAARAAGEDPPFKVRVETAKNGAAVALTAKARAQEDDLVRKTLQDVVDRVVADHKKLSAPVRTRLEGQLGQARVKLAYLRDEAVLKAKLAAAERKIAKAKAELERLKDPATLAEQRAAIDEELRKARAALQELKDPVVFAVPRREAEQRVAQAKARAADLAADVALVRGQLKRLDRLEQLLGRNIDRLQKDILEAERLKQEGIKEATDEARAMAMLMLENEIRRARDRLYQLEERLYVELPREREKLKEKLKELSRQTELAEKELGTAEAALKRLVRKREFDIMRLEPRLALLEARRTRLLHEHERKIAEAEAELAQLRAERDRVRADHARLVSEAQDRVKTLESQIKGMVLTRAVVPPVRSPEPVGLHGPVAIAIGLFGGLMLGVLLALGAEFSSKVRERVKGVGEAPVVEGGGGAATAL